MRAGARLIALIAIVLLWPGALIAHAAEEVDLLLVLSSDALSGLLCKRHHAPTPDDVSGRPWSVTAAQRRCTPSRRRSMHGRFRLQADAASDRRRRFGGWRRPVRSAAGRNSPAP
jgi:hypothetical protein